MEATKRRRMRLKLKKKFRLVLHSVVWAHRVFLDEAACTRLKRIITQREKRRRHRIKVYLLEILNSKLCELMRRRTGR